MLSDDLSFLPPFLHITKRVCHPRFLCSVALGEKLPSSTCVIVPGNVFGILNPVTRDSWQNP